MGNEKWKICDEDCPTNEMKTEVEDEAGWKMDVCCQSCEICLPLFVFQLPVENENRNFQL